MEEENEFPVNNETLQLLFEKIIELNNLLGMEIKVLFDFESKKKKLYKLSSINYSLINRAININTGYISLFNLENYICAASLLRIQIENCLRMFGFTIMDDMPNCLDKFLNGEEYKNLKGNGGFRLYDSYLAKEIDKAMPQYNFAIAYKQYCELIHFSGIFQNINHLFEEKDIGTNVTLFLGGGKNIPHFNILRKIEYTKSLFYSTKIIYKLFKSYRMKMQEF